MSGRRIAFINPFGTDAYDRIIEETLGPLAMNDTTLDVRNLIGAPVNIDYFWPKHLLESAVFEECMRIEEEGFDAIIVGCCYDPGVRVARELVDIPVVGPLEASLGMSSFYGHRPTVITDHHKAVPYIEDLVRLYGQANVRNVRCIDWWVTEMIQEPSKVAADAVAACERALGEDDADLAVLACTIIAACLMQHTRATGEYRDVPVVNPNLLALKAAESLADLWQRGEYRISRRNYYEKQSARDPIEFEQVRRDHRSTMRRTEPTGA
jgi:allantoin racemase